MGRRLPIPTLVAICTYFALIAALWLAARRFEVARLTGGSPVTALASLAVLLAPYWAFGFGAATPIRSVLRTPWVRILSPGMLVSSYIIFTIPRGEFRWSYAAALFFIPVAVAALLETIPPSRGQPDALCWQDALALLLLGLPVMFRWLHGAWPHPGLSAMPKLLLTDAGLYGYLVVRRLEGVGYDLRPRWRDLGVGLREWALFAPIAIVLGFLLHFIRFHAVLPDGWTLAAAWLATFFTVAIPEEFFFRGLLMNLLEPRLGPRGALLVSAIFFGFSHFNKRAVFNWRYVILAFLAGVFYGRAWRDRRRLLASGITHATVDVVWGAWLR